MAFVYRKLRGRIVEKYETQANFAAALGLSEVALSHKLCGKTEFSQSDIVRWAELLELVPEDYAAYFFELELSNT